DATLVTCHSEKEQTAATYKRGFGYHPLLCFLENTGEALAGVVRPGNAGANTAADHITRPGRGPGPDPRRPPPRHRYPHTRRQRRRSQSLSRPRQSTARAEYPHLLLRRVRRHRTGPPRNP